jgi:hypothetical protein
MLSMTSMINVRIVYFLYTDFLAAGVVIVIQYGLGFSIIAYGYDHVDPITTIRTICKIYYYNQQSTSMMQRWFMTAASFDRYACTSRRAGLRRFATVRVARRVVLVIVLIWLVIPVYRLVFYDLQSNVCDIFGDRLLALVHSIYTAFAGAIFPPLVMIPSLLLIQRNLALKRQRRHQITVQQREGRNEAQEADQRRDQQVLAIMLVQVIAYIITVIPVMSFEVYMAITDSIPNKSTDRIIIEQFVSLITYMLGTVYSAVPFYLNTITSRIFREELMFVIRNVLCCRWLTSTDRVQPFQNNIEAKNPIVGHQLKTSTVSKPAVPNGKMLECAIKADPQQADMDQNMAQ